jgi:phenylacetate-coenzyme A ligase PaaK-like adenylate-forming protein
MLAGIEGREEDVLSLGGVTVFPNVFHSALERIPVAGWQVIDEDQRLRVLLAGNGSVDTATAAESVRLALARVGVVDVPVQVDLVEAIPRTALGKAPLVRGRALAAASHQADGSARSLRRSNPSPSIDHDLP